MFSPDGLVVCHLPYGPTASFSISNTIMRHDIPNVGTMSEAFPHLIFHNFKTKLGQRVSLRLILKVYYWGKPERAPHRSLLRENRCSYVCVCVSAIRHPCVVLVHVRVVQPACVIFNVDDHFHLEMIVNITS